MSGDDRGPIHGRSRRSISGWEPGVVFELDNGQRWRVLDGNIKLMIPMPAPAVVLRFDGRDWWLEVDPQLPAARVERLADDDAPGTRPGAS